ncbi:RNA cap guanine-N2 methyltransferase [Toxoplasma gondii CAST]|uniref:Trimethylguanosine synthase n=1 Tax=Toxoplasma gondii CAST TaxID=943122 RepID=A0A425HUM8_TOXGO|nr:RNA cap guanine-N2 methyltransferase [Toxoplasma gondii CAST]
MRRDTREARRTARPRGSWRTRPQKKRSRELRFSAENATHRERYERITNAEEGGDSRDMLASRDGRRPNAEEEEPESEQKDEEKKEGGGEQCEGEEAKPVSESRWQDLASDAETKSIGGGRRKRNLGSGGDSRNERGDRESLQNPEKETGFRGDSTTRLRETTRGSPEQQTPGGQAGRSRRRSPEESESKTRRGKRRKTRSGESENTESVGDEELLQTCEEIPRASSPSSFSPVFPSLCVSSPSVASSVPSSCHSPSSRVFQSAVRDAFGESEKRRRPPSRLLLLPSAFSSPADLSSLPLETDEATERSLSSRRRGLAKKALSSSLSEAERDKDAGSNDPSSVKDPKRFTLFHRFDQGIQLDEDMLWSVSYEDMALQMASCCSCPLLWDAFGGVAGNATHFARGFCGFVVCSELSPERVRMAKHNVSVYGRQVASRVDFVLGDFRHLSSRIFRRGTFDGIFLAPPWGGPAYQASPVFNLRRLGANLDAFDIVRNAARLAPSAALYLPRNTRLGDIQEFAELFDSSRKGDRESDAGRTDAFLRDEGERLKNDDAKRKTGAPVSKALSFAPPGPPAEPRSPTAAAIHKEERKAEGEEGNKKTGSLRASQEETREEGQPSASCSSDPQTNEDELCRSLDTSGASPAPALAVVLLHANRLQFGQKAPKLKFEKGDLWSKATLTTAERQQEREAGRRFFHPGKEDASAWSSESGETTSGEAGKATADSERIAKGGETQDATGDRVSDCARMMGEVEKVTVGGEPQEASAFESALSPGSPSSLRPRVTSCFDENAFLGVSACGIVACPRCARRAYGRRKSPVTAEKEVREEREQTEEVPDFHREAEELDCSARTADMVDASWEPWRALCPFQGGDNKREEDSNSASRDRPVDVPLVRSASLPSSPPSWRWKLVGITVYLGDFARRLYSEVASSPSSSFSVSSSSPLSSSGVPSSVSSLSARSSEAYLFSPVAGPHPAPCGSSAFPFPSVAGPLSLSQPTDATTRVLAVLQSLGRASLHLLGLMPPRSLPQFGVSASLPRYFSPPLISRRSASGGGDGGEATGAPLAVGDRTAGETQDERNAEEDQTLKARKRRNAFSPRSPGHVEGLGEGQQQGTHGRQDSPTAPLVLSPFGVPLSLLPPDDRAPDKAPERPGCSRTGDAAEDQSAAVRVSSSLRGRRFVTVGRAKPVPLGGGCRMVSQSREAEGEGSHVQTPQGRKRRRSETANAIELHTLPSLSSERKQLHSWVYGGFVPSWTEGGSEGELDKSHAKPKVGKEASGHSPACRSSGEATEEEEEQRRAVQRPEDGEGEKGETEVGKAAETRDRDKETSQLLWKASRLLLSLEVKAQSRKQGEGEEVQEGKESKEHVPDGASGGDEKGIERSAAGRVQFFLLPAKQLSSIFLHLFLAAVVERTLDVRGVDPRQNVIWSRYADQGEREHGDSSARGRQTKESRKPEEAARKRTRRAADCPSSEREAEEEDTEEKQKVEGERRDLQMRRCHVVDEGNRSRMADSAGVGNPSNKGEERRCTAEEERECGARAEGRQTRSGQSVSAERDTDLHPSSGTTLLVNSLFIGTAKAAIERAFPQFSDVLMDGDVESGRQLPENAEAKQSETLLKNEGERRPSLHVAREIACSLMNNSSFQWILNLHVERLVSILAACK